MNYCGLDLGKKSSHFCIVGEDREVIKEGKVRTREKDLRGVFGKTSRIKIAIEASSRTFWVADRLEQIGHEVIVVDPGKTKAIGSGKIKHDELDARILASLCAADILAEIDRPTEEERIRRMPVVARDGVVRSRVRLVNLTRSLIESEGIEVPKCALGVFTRNVRATLKNIRESVNDGISKAVEPLLNAIDALTEQINTCDSALKQSMKQDETAQLLMTAPGVGPVVAACYMIAIRDPKRFTSGRAAGAYLGLVPSLYASGQTIKRGRITKHGNRQARWALSMAASVLLGPCKKDSDLKRWGMRLVERIGRKKAVVAVARKLTAVLYAMWRDNRPFEPRMIESA